MSGPENRENSANQPVWRRAPPDKLRRNTGVFPAVPGFKIADIADALLEQGYADILSIQVSSQTKVTLSDSQTLQRLCDNNFILGEETVFVLPFVKPTIELQIFDVAVWVEDNVIIQALSCFGRVVGEIRHGFVKASNGSRIGTGVRFEILLLHQDSAHTIPIPSYVHADSKNVLRVRHEGQIPTCRQCEQSSHQAASCPTKQPRPAYPYTAALSSTSPRTHAPEANSENQMKNSHSPNQDKQASEPALSSSDVDARQKQDTLERQQDSSSALEESQRVDSSSESEGRCDEDWANHIIADASSYELAIETAIQSEIVRERSRMHANPTDQDSAVPTEAAITDSTSNSRGQTRSEGTANADTKAPPFHALTLWPPILTAPQSQSPVQPPLEDRTIYPSLCTSPAHHNHILGTSPYSETRTGYGTPTTYFLSARVLPMQISSVIYPPMPRILIKSLNSGPTGGTLSFK